MRPMSEPPPILVAEDSDDDFVLFRQALKAAGIANPVLRFRDGADLIKFLEQTPPKPPTADEGGHWILFLDLQMPVVDGFEVLRWLGKRVGLPPFRTIMLSGSVRPVDIARTMQLGAADYLIKPATPALLAAALGKQQPAPALQN
jgi:CheY-like chemotaxis protein